MSQDQVLRQILDEINRDPEVSQRKLSSELGVSGGSINWHLKRCVSKGLVKLREAPMRRYLYYLTPEGFSEKARLTAEFLQASFDIVRTGRQQYEALAQLCAANGWRTLVLLGDSELAELALLVIARHPELRAPCILEPGGGGRMRAGLPVIGGQDTVPAASMRADAAIATQFDILVSKADYLGTAERLFGLGSGRILVPQFLQ